MLKADGSSKRFYKSAGVTESEQNCPRTGALQKAWVLTLDDRGVRTPSNKQMVLPCKNLAMAIALEFDVQDLNILPYTMPLTTLATTAIDQLSRAEVRKSAVTTMVKQLSTDLITLRSTEPDDLVEKEQSLWGPICAWASANYGCEVVTSSEWLSMEQNPLLLKAVAADLESRSDWTIAAIDQVGALAAARAVEQYQIDRWGKVEACGMGGHDIDEADMRSRIAAALLFHRLLPQSHI
ncbi:hypothetical protein T484DRAFT_1976862 [Baffinella frigidus]|nr:hypothetical protein T484DRAFT_1976862 [Cryptophyta sp. CCMP2293]